MGQNEKDFVMDNKKTKRARERVERIFQEMSEGKENPAAKKNVSTLGQIMEESGIDINEVTSPKFSKIMKNMGKEELVLLLAFKSIIPCLLLKLNIEAVISTTEMETLASAYGEISQIYTYALIKMAVMEDISNISTRDEELIQRLIAKFKLTSLLEQKTLCLLINFCNSIIRVTTLLCNKKVVKSVNDILGSYVLAMRKTFFDYVKEERIKNGLKEE